MRSLGSPRQLKNIFDFVPKFQLFPFSRRVVSEFLRSQLFRYKNVPAFFREMLYVCSLRNFGLFHEMPRKNTKFQISNSRKLDSLIKK